MTPLARHGLWQTQLRRNSAAVPRRDTMRAILIHLPDGARVLDLGSKGGSFRSSDYPGLIVIRADLEKPDAETGRFVQADAAALPFPSGCFDAIVLNHCLEHFVRLRPALQEIGRCISRRGAIFVAAPDSTTVTDRLYRALYYASGGHVNRFRSEGELSTMLAWYFGLPLAGGRVLGSGLVCFNRRTGLGIPVTRHIRFRGVWEPALAVASGILRLVDRRFETRLSVYGWALYFGSIHEELDTAMRPNVCVRCGQGCPADWLTHLGVVRKRWLIFRVYRCPECGATNVFTREAAR
jgi:SAM-dependent methyltransferase